MMNKNTSFVYNYGQMGFYTKEWKDIKVGDLVCIENDKEAPADILVI